MEAQCIRCLNVSVVFLFFFIDMADIEAQMQKISSAIAAVFPDLPVAVFKSVVETLKTLGMETTDDLQYVTEQDLLPVLKPIQARRLVGAWAQNSKCIEIKFHDI